MTADDPYARSWISPETLALLRKDHWFGSVPQALETALLSRATPRRIAHGEQVIARGGPADGMFAVLEGALRVSGVTEAGKSTVLSIVEAPCWVGEISLFDQLPRTHTVTAEGATRLLHVPQSDLEELLEQAPRYWRDFGRLMALRVRLAFIGIEDLAMLPAESRLARRLLLLCQSAATPPTDGHWVVPISQAQLGMMLSLSRQTTNQVLQSLQDQGIVQVSYGRIDVCDMAQLITVADLSITEQHILQQLQSGAGERLR